MTRATQDGTHTSTCCGLSCLLVQYLCFWPSLTIAGYFSQAVDLVKSDPRFQQVHPFRVRLEKFSFSPNSKFLHLDVTVVNTEPMALPIPKGKKKGQVTPPKNPLQTLHKILSDIFPSCAKEPSASEKKTPTGKKTGTPCCSFSPHLTVAQLPQDQIQEKCTEFQNSWTPVEFEVNEIFFLSRKSDSEKMKILGSVKLVGK